ncbi:CapA family protein [Micromonospora sp. WMMC250]|uniref:CapA family protein n=1 Tax=Micromonospora sp. WMMC250 TaxID=3014781 RepID=UPI0022B73FB0|nr:CapA family protein [Micromonospora sp. WMMC250]MCZ7379817.1 CapA family protein [Micromonospora sp. WMMC250]
MGDLEEHLTVNTDTDNCGANSTRCFQLQAPPEYTTHLREAGFDVLNQANNLGYDYSRGVTEHPRRALRGASALLAVHLAAKQRTG